MSIKSTIISFVVSLILAQFATANDRHVAINSNYPIAYSNNNNNGYLQSATNYQIASNYRPANQWYNSDRPLHVNNHQQSNYYRQALASNFEQSAQASSGYETSNVSPVGNGADYGNNYASGYGQQQQQQQQQEDRPRIRVNLGLFVPAIRFRMPQMSLPKITINAKVKQPNRPRTFYTPEFMIDTASKLEPPGQSGQSGDREYAGGQTQGYGTQPTSHYERPTINSYNQAEHQSSGYHNSYMPNASPEDEESGGFNINLGSDSDEHSSGNYQSSASLASSPSNGYQNRA